MKHWVKYLLVGAAVATAAVILYQCYLRPIMYKKKEEPTVVETVVEKTKESKNLDEKIRLAFFNPHIFGKCTNGL